ncbi:MAG: AAA family ATPase [Opitutales bacterium]
MPEEMRQDNTLTGVLERFIFYNEENAYCVAELSVPGESRPVTVLGRLPGVQCGETLELNGRWTRHREHGEQFSIDSFTSKLPASVHGIRKYLGSGMVHGIGRNYASKIVDHFGADTLRIISEESGRLHEIPGIGEQRAKAIKTAWDEQRAVRDVMMFLQTYGVTPAQCVRLVKKYGSGAKRILQDQPYRLAEDIERIGFKTADKIALNLGFPTQSKERIDAGVLHTMSELESDGHTLATEETLVERAAELLSLDPSFVITRIRELIKSNRLRSVEALDEQEQHIGPACQLPQTADAEKRIAEAVARIASANSGLPAIKIDAAIEWAHKQLGVDFADRQKDALRTALEQKVAIITGGPGTGKTTILRALTDILQAKQARVLLASPTGRAAQRLAEATGMPAGTVHRLLKYDPATQGFVHNRDNPIPCDYLILDETSMLDNRLASRLFPAVPRSAHLLLVGDADQLPSVGAGNILGDLMSGPPAAVTRLDTIYRQQDQSGIIATAHRILEGEAHPGRTYQSLRELDPAEDVNFIEADAPEKTLQAILYLAREYIPKNHRLDPIRDLQILSPMHRGQTGISNLNTQLQETLNPAETAAARVRAGDGNAPPGQTHFREKTGKRLPFEIEYGGTSFRIGDKVIQTRNNYDKNVFNGDSGVIRSISPDGGTLTVTFNGNAEGTDFTKSELGELQLAYAISIHKSQGSEYPVVVIPLLKQHYLLLQRNLIYTGITRARRKVYIIGSTDAYRMAVQNHKTEVRRTHLRQRLRQA